MSKKKQTKAEQAAQQAAEQAERRARALRWTGPGPDPDVLPPAQGADGLTTGYVYNTYYRRIHIACSSSTGHSYDRTDKATSQRPIPLYSTRLLALRALRAALEIEFADALVQVDRQIEASS